MSEPHDGWHLVALSSELTEPVSPLALGSRALVAVRHQGSVRIYDGACPHRGAHLGYGGVLAEGPAVICPFHGRRIGLGAGPGRLRVRAHDVIDCGGAVFVRLAEGGGSRDHGFAVVLKEIMATHELTGAVVGRVAVPPELVIENAFDFDHFSPVHGVSRLARPTVSFGEHGELTISTAFRTGTLRWEAAGGGVTSRFFARVFSPGVVVTELGPPESSHVVITGASPAPGGCVTRIAVGARRGVPAATVTALVDGARRAFEQDVLVWDHLVPGAAENLDARDAPVRAFRAFCATFG
jgi:nitrite reductase/ring-hydroxylating ferredoxin subunit